MIFNMVCPDIKKEDTRNKYNFNLAICQRRFQMRADCCVRCPEGTHWFMKRIMGEK